MYSLFKLAIILAGFCISHLPGFNSDMSALHQDIVEQIKQLCAAGYEQYDKGDFAQAIRLFYQAWIKLPKPQTDHVEAGWVLTALGDAYFQQHKYEQAIEALNSALFCPNLTDNPFLHLRLGQCHWEMNNPTQARSYLFKAYRHGGEALLRKELPKYSNAIADLLSEA